MPASLCCLLLLLRAVVACRKQTTQRRVRDVAVRDLECILFGQAADRILHEKLACWVLARVERREENRDGARDEREQDELGDARPHPLVDRMRPPVVERLDKVIEQRAGHPTQDRNQDEQQNEQKVASLLQEGLELYGTGDVARAFLVWGEALELDPGNEEALDYMRDADRRSKPRGGRSEVGLSSVVEDARRLMRSQDEEAAFELLQSAPNTIGLEQEARGEDEHDEPIGNVVPANHPMFGEGRWKDEEADGSDANSSGELEILEK